MSKNYDEILNLAYQKYKEDWCKIRNFPLEKVEKANVNDEEYEGQMFACLDEFECCEFQDIGYMMYLLLPSEFESWKIATDNIDAPKLSTYVLVTVINRYIALKHFQTYEEALNTMIEEFSEKNKLIPEDIKKEIVNVGYCEIIPKKSFISDMGAFCDKDESYYDWKIFPIQ